MRPMIRADTARTQYGKGVKSEQKGKGNKYTESYTARSCALQYFLDKTRVR